MGNPKYILRAVTFENVVESAVNVVRSRERLNKNFVIVSAVLGTSDLSNMPQSKFDAIRMGFADLYTFYKKMSLLPITGAGGNLVVPQLWMVADLIDFEIPSGYLYLDQAAVNPDIDFPIVHVLEVLRDANN